MAEILGIDAFVFARLSADAGLAASVGDRVYARMAPQGAAYPLVVWAVQAASDLVGPGAVRIWASALVQVQAIGPAPATGLQAIAARIDACLHGAPPQIIAVGGRQYQIHGAQREGGLDFTSEIAGQVFVHLGGLYRIWCTEIGG